MESPFGLALLTVTASDITLEIFPSLQNLDCVGPEEPASTKGPAGKERTCPPGGVVNPPQREVGGGSHTTEAEAQVMLWGTF